MRCIAITGGIACGKSTLARFLVEMGGDVFDTDHAVHALEAPGGPAVAPLRAVFGAEILDAVGGIDRAKLGRLVFECDEARLCVNAIVHPLVRAAVDAWRVVPTAGSRFKAALVPLLFEVGWDTAGWDAVVCVVCRRDEQLRRLQARGLTPVEARRRIAAQWSMAAKARRSDYVIRNDGGLEQLRAAARDMLAAVLEKDA